jgi:hypothetical protein
MCLIRLPVTCQSLLANYTTVPCRRPQQRSSIILHNRVDMSHKHQLHEAEKLPVALLVKNILAFHETRRRWQELDIAEP